MLLLVLLLYIQRFRSGWLKSGFRTSSGIARRPFHSPEFPCLMGGFPHVPSAPSIRCCHQNRNGLPSVESLTFDSVSDPGDRGIERFPLATLRKSYDFTAMSSVTSIVWRIGSHYLSNSYGSTPRSERANGRSAALTGAWLKSQDIGGWIESHPSGSPSSGLEDPGQQINSLGSIKIVRKGIGSVLVFSQSVGQFGKEGSRVAEHIRGGPPSRPRAGSR